MFSVFVFLVLQNFLYGDALAGQTVPAEVHHPEGAFTGDAFDLVLVGPGCRFVFVRYRDASFVGLVWLGFERFVVVDGFVGVDFEVAAGGIGFFG